MSMSLSKKMLLALSFCAALIGAPFIAVAGGSGSCNFDSDCGGGVKCKSGKCSTAAGSGCNYDSECAGTGKCSSGKCKK